MSREAMQQALEALELYQSRMCVQMFDEAIRALRQALETTDETQTLRVALDAAVAWAAPMADAPKSLRPEWFDQARAALSHKGPIL